MNLHRKAYSFKKISKKLKNNIFREILSLLSRTHSQQGPIRQNKNKADKSRDVRGQMEAHGPLPTNERRDTGKKSDDLLLR